MAFAFSAHTDWRDCLRGFFILWFSGAGTFFVGTLFGFLFGFPKEFRDILGGIDQLAKTMDSAFSHNTGAYPVSLGVLVYGFVCGFMAYYTWARSRFRRNLESADAGLATQPGSSEGPLVGVDHLPDPHDP
jgi:hypothetical protein